MDFQSYETVRSFRELTLHWTSKLLTVAPKQNRVSCIIWIADGAKNQIIFSWKTSFLLQEHLTFWKLSQSAAFFLYWFMFSNCFLLLRVTVDLSVDVLSSSSDNICIQLFKPEHYNSHIPRLSKNKSLLIKFNWVLLLLLLIIEQTC